MKKNGKMLLLIVFFILGILLIFLIAKDLFPLVKEVLINKNNEKKSIDFIKSYGARSVPVLIGLEMIQVLFPFIPTSLVQIVIGLCYHALWGSLICLVGISSANAVLFFFVRLFSELFSDSSTKIANKKPQKKRKLFNQDFIKNSVHPGLLLFCLYLVPIFPNSLLAFLFSKSSLSLAKYTITVTSASLPSILICTFIGQHLSFGNYHMALLLACLIGLALLLCLIFKEKILTILERSA